MMTDDSIDSLMKVLSSYGGIKLKKLKKIEIKKNDKFTNDALSALVKMV